MQKLSSKSNFAHFLIYIFYLTTNTYNIKSSMSIVLARFNSELLFRKTASTFCFMSKLSGTVYNTK